MIKSIIFDCFGVLTTDTWRAFLDSLPADADFDRARELNRQRDAGLITTDDFLEQIEQLTGRRPQAVELQVTSDVIKNTALLNYIRELKKSGYKIGMISNIATNWVREKFLTPEEQALFDDMVFSYEIGTTKPDPHIFEVAYERLGVSPDHAVFIDDVDTYCEAARSLGMQAIVYHDFTQMKQELERVLAADSDN
ncbi:MAG: HAD-superfamily hydrolase, subfamily variant 3 [Candidatus Saccharibacteria bacterium]|nr:HAD-superfamily hydrolase, subfamily variant 3 [Candidatus Saccharibacteria bacterium]